MCDRDGRVPSLQLCETIIHRYIVIGIDNQMQLKNKRNASLTPFFSRNQHVELAPAKRPIHQPDGRITECG
ncbi:MAG: hypothetical protein ISS71_09490 [Phycisphaerae bacterium]|nr:hypothetical protein [Phycisphaerae bacterium]